MAFKQPKVPEYRSGERTEENLRRLILFLKDFCQEAWTASRNTDRGLAGISYPVTSVNRKTGDVTLTAADVGARSANWTPTAAQVGALASGGTAVNAGKFDGKTWAQMLATVYPVGSIYMAANSTSPASLFGGTWEQLKDRFLLGAGDTYSAGETGGTAEETLNNTQIPNHTHKIARGDTASGTNEFEANSISIFNNACQHMSARGKRYISLTGTNATNGGGSHNNMPPYLVVYMWKRVR